MVAGLSEFKNGIRYSEDVANKPTVTGHVKIGSEKHNLDSNILTVDASILEAPENVIGQPAQMVVGERRKYCMWVQEIKGQDYLFSWSNTRLAEKDWLDPHTGMDLRPEAKGECELKAAASAHFTPPTPARR